MRTSVILSEALRYFIDSEHFELSVVLFAMAVELFDGIHPQPIKRLGSYATKK